VKYEENDVMTNGAIDLGNMHGIQKIRKDMKR